MRILVTGSKGVIGQSLVPRLKELGHDVLGFDRRHNEYMDVTDRDSVEHYFYEFKPDTVIHMAASVGRINCENYPEEAVRNTILGTLEMVRICSANDVRLINFSTSEVYGHNSVFGTPDIMEQNGVYGITKLTSEALVKHYVDTQGLKACSIRPFMVYGPHETPNGIYRSAVSNFLDTAMKGGVISAHEGCIRSWCYVDDFVDGVVLVLDKHSFVGYEAFSIGTEEYRTMEECAMIAVELTGSGSYKLEKVPDFYVSAVKKADFSHISSLGFNPTTTLEQGMALTHRWLMDRNSLLEGGVE